MAATTMSEEEEHELKETATMMSTLSAADLDPSDAKRMPPQTVRPIEETCKPLGFANECHYSTTAVFIRSVARFHSQHS